MLQPKLKDFRSLGPFCLALAEAGVVARRPGFDHVVKRQRPVPFVVCTREVAIKKQVSEKRLVFGEVYAPNDLDTHGEFMTGEEIEKLAHRFMLKQLTGHVDLMHDQNSNHGTAVVESFIAREGDPDFTPGAWVLGTKVYDDGIWAAVKRGDLTGYSFQARVRKVPVTVDTKSDGANEYQGQTNSANGHVHGFTVLLDDEGNVTSGMTDVVDGHSHDITENVRTAVADGHRHTFSLRNLIASAEGLEGYDVGYE